MSQADTAKCSNFFVIFFLIIFSHFCTSAPVNVSENAYTQFIEELNRNKCSFPSQVQLPFDTTHANNFEYLSSYLEICQKTSSSKRNKEAIVLCKEIFDSIRNISCSTKTVMRDISVSLSESVCQDINALKDSVPEDDKSLLKRLTDAFLCDIMCDSEFETACQVLLWSFKVQKEIASVANVQEPKQFILPDNGGNMNAKENAEDVVEHDGNAEVPEPGKSVDNPEKKFVTKKLNYEMPISNDNEHVLENVVIPKTEGQDSIGQSKFTSNMKTPSTVTQQMSNVQASNSSVEEKPLEETTNGQFDDQNANLQLQSDAKKHGEVNSGELSHGSIAKVINNEQTQGDNTNILVGGGVQDKKNAFIFSHGYRQDNSKTPANQNISLDSGYGLSDNEIPDKTLENGDTNSNFLNNVLPHEPANEKSPNNAAADLLSNDQNPSIKNQNKLLSSTSIDGNLTEKTNSPTTNSQTIKETTQQQIASTQDKISIPGKETKSDKPDTSSVKVTKDNTKTDVVAHDPIANDGTNNPSTDQKKPIVAQQTEEFDTTILLTTEKLKHTAVNPDGKSVIPSSPLETSTKTTVALEKMEGDSDLRQPDEEEGDHFGDLENTEGDEFSESDYEGGFGEVPKSKASNPDVPSVVTAKETVNSQNEPIEFPSRYGFEQDFTDIRKNSNFPDQEDSHFFFYFLSIVLILMAGYLLFHNKQKIIALIVEGRHERNRRSHRIGYKKLETK